MSSLRNAAPRRNHKERGQLANRKKLGLLEKHKDYVLRARDYHAKQERLTRLRVKASERNKDEFYFGMVRGRTEGGVHVQGRGNPELPPDVVKVLKTQDANYIRTQKTANLRRIETLKAQLTLLADLLPSITDLTPEQVHTLRKAGLVGEVSAGKGKGKKPIVRRKSTGHVVFADNEDEANTYQPPSGHVPQEQEDEDGSDEFKLDIPPVDLESLGWLPPTPSKTKRRKSSGAPSVDESGIEVTGEGMPSTDEERKAHRSTLIAELAARQLRDTQLRYALAELELQKVLLGKGGRKKLKEAEEVKLDDEKDGKEDESEDEDVKQKAKEEKLWRPRVFKWKFVRRK